MRIAIIGSAGRGSDALGLRGDSFARMCDAAKDFLGSVLKVPLSARHLVSGGAAFADHVAVNLFLEGHAETLELALPCPFDEELKCYRDGDGAVSPSSTAVTSNHYHRRFSLVAGVNSLGELGQLISGKLAQVHVGKGFHDRNRKVAEADAVLAFTFGNGAVLKEGGTAYTMKAYLKNSAAKGRQPIAYHVDLNTWKLHQLFGSAQTELFGK